MFDLYEYPRAGSLDGRQLTVLGIVIDAEHESTWGKRVRFVVVDGAGQGARVLTDYESPRLSLHVGD
jgi:hypothetical protein